MDQCRKRVEKVTDLRDALTVLERADKANKTFCTKLKEGIMVQQPLSHQKKSPKLFVSYGVLIFAVQILLQALCFPFFAVESLQFLKTLTVVSLAVFAPCAVVAWCRGPGFIERDTSVR